MENAICWYKYKAFTADKEFVCDTLQTTDCPKISDACLSLEKQGYDIISIKKIDYVHAMSTFQRFTPVLPKYTTT